MCGTLEDLGGDFAVAKPGRRSFGELLPLVADDNDRLSGQARHPILNVAMRAPYGAGNDSPIGRKGFVDARIDQRRRVRRAD